MVTLGAGIRIYLRHRHNELSPASRRHVRNVLAQTGRQIGPDLLVRNLKRRHIEAWLASLECAPSTIRTELSVVRTFCRWAIANGYLKQDPTLGIKGPRARQGMPRELDPAAVTKTLLAAPDARAELVILLAVEEGLRVAEIAGLCRENISNELMLVHGKGNKDRWLPVCADTLYALRTYCAQVPGTSGPVIRSESHPNRGISAKYLCRLVSGWMRDAGIKTHPYDGVSAHALRHTMAGAMLDDGADIREVQAALGHESLGPTFIYTRRRQAASQLAKTMGKRSYR